MHIRCALLNLDNNKAYQIKKKKNILFGKIFLLSEFFRACSKMKSAQWGFSFTKSNIHIWFYCLSERFCEVSRSKVSLFSWKTRVLISPVLSGFT